MSEGFSRECRLHDIRPTIFGQQVNILSLHELDRHPASDDFKTFRAKAKAADPGQEVHLSRKLAVEVIARGRYTDLTSGVGTCTSAQHNCAYGTFKIYGLRVVFVVHSIDEPVDFTTGD